MGAAGTFRGGTIAMKPHPTIHLILIHELSPFDIGNIYVIGGAGHDDGCAARFQHGLEL